MIDEYEFGTYTEDDRKKELPEKYKRMTPEEREAEMERLYKEMKANPCPPKRGANNKTCKVHFLI